MNIWGIYFSDDWDDNGRDSFQPTKEGPKARTAQHRKKFTQLEDAYNARQQAIVNFGHWLIANDNRLAGWYHSVVTIELELKFICMGLILHFLYITHGPLTTYKLFISRAYGRKSDEVWRQNIRTLQPFRNGSTFMTLCLTTLKGKVIVSQWILPTQVTSWHWFDLMSPGEDQHGADSIQAQNWRRH